MHFDPVGPLTENRSQTEIAWSMELSSTNTVACDNARPASHRRPRDSYEQVAAFVAADPAQGGGVQFVWELATGADRDCDQTGCDPPARS